MTAQSCLPVISPTATRPYILFYKLPTYLRAVIRTCVYNLIKHYFCGSFFLLKLLAYMEPVNFRSYRKKLSYYRKSFRTFLNGTEKNPPRGIDTISPVLEKEVWKEVDCLSCANCCKKM